MISSVWGASVPSKTIQVPNPGYGYEGINCEYLIWGMRLSNVLRVFKHWLLIMCLILLLLIMLSLFYPLFNTPDTPCTPNFIVNDSLNFLVNLRLNLSDVSLLIAIIFYIYKRIYFFTFYVIYHSCLVLCIEDIKTPDETENSRHWKIRNGIYM